MQLPKDKNRLPDPLLAGTGRMEDRTSHCPLPEHSDPLMDRRNVTTTFAYLHRALIDWIGLTEDDMCILTYLSTIAEACLVNVDEQTGDYKSSLILLLWEDEYAVLIDVEDKSIMAGTPKESVLRLELPHAARIRDVIRRYYNSVRSVRKLDTIAGADGTTKNLFK